MSKYTPPRYPSAAAARRKGDLESQKKAKARRSQRQDRRRAAFITMKKRYRIVREYIGRRRTCASEAEAARQTSELFGISVSTVRRWYKDFINGGKRALMPSYQKYAPPGSSLPFEIIQIILALRTLLGWCGQRIAAELMQRGIAVISHTTVYRLFKRYSVPTRTYHPKGKSDGIQYRRQQVKTANWTWHIDFAGPWEDSAGITRSLLIVIDSYSRMLLCLEVIEDQKAAAVENILTRLFDLYGTPKVIITDNGRAFAPSVETWKHRFPAFLASNGIEHRRTKPYYPQTNGKAEAAVKIIEREFLRHSGREPGGIWHWAEISDLIPEFQAWYNYYRAHGALNYNVPARLYAGITMEKHGLKNIFGFLPGSQTEPKKLPSASKENRIKNLSLISAD